MVADSPGRAQGGFQARPGVCGGRKSRPSPHTARVGVAKRRRCLRRKGLRPRASQAYLDDTSRSPTERNTVAAGRYVAAAGCSCNMRAKRPTPTTRRAARSGGAGRRTCGVAGPGTRRTWWCRFPGPRGRNGSGTPPRSSSFVRGSQNDMTSSKRWRRYYAARSLRSGVHMTGAPTGAIPVHPSRSQIRRAPCGHAVGVIKLALTPLRRAAGADDCRLRRDSANTRSPM